MDREFDIPRPSRKARALAVLASLAVAACALCLAGCGGGADSSSEESSSAPSTTSSEVEEGTEAETESTPNEVEPEPVAVEPPEVGTELTSVYDPGSVNVVADADGEGFSIVDDVVELSTEEDQSTVTTFDVAGNELARISEGSLTGSCGAADLVVPEVGRLIITELEGYTETAGIEQTEYPATLTAWDAETGELLWRTAIRPEAGEEWEEAGCEGDGGLGGFSATADGRWGVFGGDEIDFGGARVIDLKTGKVQPGVHAEGVIGNYVITSPGESDYGDRRYEAIDPSTGAVQGSAALDVDFYQQMEGLTMAARGALYDDGGGESPAASSTDGERLIVVEEGFESDEPQTPNEMERSQVVAYALPGFEVAWRRPGSESGLAAEGGGVVLESRYDQAQETTIFVGLDEATGKPVWQLPAGEVCGMTESQLLIAVNGQLSTIEIASGEQVSYEETPYCPTVLRGGLGLNSEGGEIGEETGLTVLQILEP